MKIKILFFLMLFLPTGMQAWDDVIDGIFYNFSDAGAEVTGCPQPYIYEGDIEIPSQVSFNGESYPVTRIGNRAFNSCTLNSISIPEGVTSIGESAFSVSEIGSISLPNTLERIEQFAFSSCQISSIELPDSITSIGEYAFSNSSLTSITIPALVKNIATEAFYSCKSLASVTILDGVGAIGNSAFMGCDKLTAVTIPASVTSIGNSAFSGCAKLQNLNIPGKLTFIGKSAFYNCESLTSVIIPGSVTSIEAAAFMSCKNLTSVIIQSGVENIKNSAFYNCGIDSISIPGTVKNIEDMAFTICQNLEKIVLSEGVENIGYGAFATCENLILLSLPNSLKNIGKNAFSRCYYLSSVTLPDSVTVGSAAFADCTNLLTVNIPESVTKIAADAFTGTRWYNSKPNGWVYINKMLHSYKGTMPENTTIVIPEGIESISENAFYECKELFSISIPSSVTYIGTSAFYNASNLDTIKVFWEEPLDLKADANILYGVKSACTLKVPVGKRTIYLSTKIWGGLNVTDGCENCVDDSDPDFVIEDGVLLGYKGNRKHIVIPETVTSIANNAFLGGNFSIVDIPRTVTNIGTTIFTFCPNLSAINVDEANQYYASEDGVLFNKEKTSLIWYPESKIGLFYDIPDGVTHIENEAFAGCDSIYYLSVPQSVTNIKFQAFAYMHNLKEVTVYWDKPLSISQDVFGGFPTSGVQLFVPKNTKTIYQTAPVWKDFFIINETTEGVKSNDVSIKTLSIDNEYFYNITQDTVIVVKTNIDSVYITVTPSHDGAIVSGSGDGYRKLKTGLNVFNLTVTAEDRKTTGNYRIDVWYEDNENPKSNDATLKSILVSAGALNYDFVTVNIPVKVANQIDSVTFLDIVPNDIHAKIDSAAFGRKKLEFGENKFDITVTAEDSVTTKTYTVVFIREAADDDASLKSIIVAGEEYFMENDSVLTLNVENEKDTISIRAVANNPDATVSLLEKPLLNDWYMLKVGQNEFKITVIAKDSVTRKDYFVMINRAKSDDAALRILSVQPGDFEYDALKTFHIVNVDYKTDEISINAITRHPNAVVDGLGTFPVTFGENWFWITVTAENGAEKVDTVVVNRENLPIVVTPTEDAAEVVVQYVENAAGYTFNIYGDKDYTDLICTMKFDAQGNLIEMSILRAGSAGRVEGSGFSYTVENLLNNTTYYYMLSAFDAENVELTSQNGSFRTTGESGTVGVVNQPSTTDLPKVIGYYTISGVKLSKEPVNGVYIIRYEDGSHKKAVR